MKKISYLYTILSRHKYLIVTVVGVLVIGFLDTNSIYRRIELSYEILDLKNEIEQYESVYKADLNQLRDLERDPRNIERIARERYFMKADDEDIYVLSTDPRGPQDMMKKEDGNETEE